MNLWKKNNKGEIRGLEYNSLLLKLTLAFIAIHCIIELITELTKTIRKNYSIIHY
jgi:hypothetical protein